MIRGGSEWVGLQYRAKLTRWWDRMSSPSFYAQREYPMLSPFVVVLVVVVVVEGPVAGLSKNSWYRERTISSSKSFDSWAALGTRCHHSLPTLLHRLPPSATIRRFRTDRRSEDGKLRGGVGYR